MLSFKGEQVTQTKYLLEKKMSEHSTQIFSDIFHRYNDHIFQIEDMDILLEKYK